MPLYVNRRWKRCEKYSLFRRVDSFMLACILKKRVGKVWRGYSTRDTAFRFSRSVVPQIKRINDQRYVSWRQRHPAVLAVIALDLTFILRRFFYGVLNPFLTIIFVGSDKESYRRNEQARLNLKAVLSTSLTCTFAWERKTHFDYELLRTNCYTCSLSFWQIRRFHNLFMAAR
jgi:hypothetical protein